MVCLCKKILLQRLKSTEQSIQTNREKVRQAEKRTVRGHTQYRLKGAGVVLHIYYSPTCYHRHY